MARVTYDPPFSMKRSTYASIRPEGMEGRGGGGMEGKNGRVREGERRGGEGESERGREGEGEGESERGRRSVLSTMLKEDGGSVLI